jgi:simple sugar transport system ATP-binding protein
MANNEATPTRDIVLEAKGITKKFPGVLANDDVNFDLRKGEIHALLGENGAGKSTLMNILYGLYHPEAGEVTVEGNKMVLNSSRDAIKHGIGMVHQHFMLIPVFTVTENIMLGEETSHRAAPNENPLVKLDRKEVSQKVRELSHQYGLEVDPDAIVGDLPVGIQQRVEIVKAIYRKANILILDEPTAVLTPQEAEDLFRIMHDLTKKGVSIIFITHAPAA